MRIPMAAADMAAAAGTVAVVMRVEDQWAAVMSGVGRQEAVTSAETVEDIVAGRSEVWRMAVQGILHSVP